MAGLAVARMNFSHNLPPTFLHNTSGTKRQLAFCGSCGRGKAFVDIRVGCYGYHLDCSVATGMARRPLEYAYNTRSTIAFPPPHVLPCTCTTFRWPTQKRSISRPRWVCSRNMCQNVPKNSQICGKIGSIFTNLRQGVVYSALHSAVLKRCPTDSALRLLFVEIYSGVPP